MPKDYDLRQARERRAGERGRLHLYQGTTEQFIGDAVRATLANQLAERFFEDMGRRGTIEAGDDGRQLLLDDNTSPTDAFLWAGGLKKGPDVQFNNVWNASRDGGAYTALWNLCATPASLAKTTDGSNHPDVVAALRYHAYSLYGRRPADEPEPREPDAYQSLRWAPHPAPVTDLESELRARMRSNPKRRTTIACREIGWLFSNWEPDPTL